MELNSIINNSDITSQMQDIYKYVKKNDEKFDDILDATFEDLRVIYLDIVKTQDYVEIPNPDNDNIMITREKCQTVLNHHAADILGDHDYLVSYAFKIQLINNRVRIGRKR